MIIRDICAHIRRRYNAYVSSRYTTIAGKQKFHVYFFTLLTAISICLVNLLDISGPGRPVIQYMVAAVLVVNILSAILYFTRKMPLNTAFYILILTSLVETIAEMIVLSFSPTTYGLMLIIGNIALLIVLSVLPVIAYTSGLTYIVGGLSIATYITCALITGSKPLLSFMFIYIAIFLFISAFGEMIVRQYLRSEKENRQMASNEKAMLEFFNMDKDELTTFIRLSKAKGLDMHETEQLLDSIGHGTKERLMNTLSHYLLEKESDRDRLIHALPELTDSEIDICRLIVQGKKLGEMSRLLGKSPSNITCQRSNIRAKLKLSKEESLSEAISARLARKSTKKA